MDEYAKINKRVKPIHKPNWEYGSAVNIGIEKATGDYIAILETDDFVHTRAYELLYKKALENDSDFVKCAFYHYNSYNNIKTSICNYNFSIINSMPDGNFNVIEYPKIMMYHASVWAALYKSSFIKGIKFIEKEYYQDFPFYIEALCKAKKISVIKKH